MPKLKKFTRAVDPTPDEIFARAAAIRAAHLADRRDQQFVRLDRGFGRAAIRVIQSVQIGRKGRVAFFA